MLKGNRTFASSEKAGYESWKEPIEYADSLSSEEESKTWQDKAQVILHEIVRMLRKLWDYFLCCVTCGCYRPGGLDLASEVYETELMEEEREAVHDLLAYLDSADSKEPTINDARLKALCVLTYSDNDTLQRSAALCFAEISDRMRSAVPEIALEPLIVLLRSRDAQVQKAASLAMSNFALNGPEINKSTLMQAGCSKPLVQLLYSRHTEVQTNTCGCITTLATNAKNKQAIVAAGGIRPLLILCQSRDVRVQRNATGALLNLTHLQCNREELVRCGALPVLVDVLHSRDSDVQYYCAAALSNMAVNERHRAMMTAVGHYDVIRRLLTLLRAKQEKVTCQACLALRNLASDPENQINIVKLDGLPALHHVVEVSSGEILTAALACLRNLSINRANEAGIIAATFLAELQKYVQFSDNPDAQAHAAGTIRNLAVGDGIKVLCVSGCVRALMDVLLDETTVPLVLQEVTAALAVLADDDINKDMLLGYRNGAAFSRLVSLASTSQDAEVQYNSAGTLGQLVLKDIDALLLARCMTGLLTYLGDFMRNADQNFIHISLWTIVQLLRFRGFRSAFLGDPSCAYVHDLSTTSRTAAIRELTNTVINSLSSSDEHLSSSLTSEHL